MAWYIPLFIFLARICDVSIGTVRIITVIRGHKVIAAMLGFCEVVIWIFAVSAVIAFIRESLVTVIAYGAGFATGTLVGMVIEEKLAIGNQMIRVVNTNSSISVSSFLRGRNLIVTEVEASGATGAAELCFLVVPRKKTQTIVRAILRHCPKAFVTVEDIRSATSGSQIFPARSQSPLWRRLIKF